jgi:hypothetical protein
LKQVAPGRAVQSVPPGVICGSFSSRAVMKKCRFEINGRRSRDTALHREHDGQTKTRGPQMRRIELSADFHHGYPRFRFRGA